jgi:hypothetical protein
VLMEACYIAHGLLLRSTFPLVGMTPLLCEHRESSALQELALERIQPTQLMAGWSGSRGGPSAEPSWRGRLGDGHELTLQEGVDDDVLFAYGERSGSHQPHACFHLDGARRSLKCATFDGDGDDVDEQLGWQRALLTKVLASVSLLLGYEALHASAVDCAQGAVAIVAPPGTGKTTLALELVRRGHRLLCDDVLTLGHDVRGVRAHPATPHMNLPLQQGRALPLPMFTPLTNTGDELWGAIGAVAQRARPLRLICLLRRREQGRGRKEPLPPGQLPPGPLPLAPYMLGLDDDAKRQRQRFALYAELAATAEIVPLSYGADEGPAATAERIENMLASGAATELTTTSSSTPHTPTLAGSRALGSIA